MCTVQKGSLMPILFNPGPPDPLFWMFWMFYVSVLRLMGHWPTCARIDETLMKRPIHLNQACWSRETCKTSRGVDPEDKDLETLPYVNLAWRWHWRLWAQKHLACVLFVRWISIADLFWNKQMPCIPGHKQKTIQTVMNNKSNSLALVSVLSAEII